MPSPKKAIAKVYVVCENVPGEMPETDPFWSRCKRVAEMFATNRARDWRDAGYKVTGNRIDGYNAEEGPLGTVIRIETTWVPRSEWERYIGTQED